MADETLTITVVTSHDGTKLVETIWFDPDTNEHWTNHAVNAFQGLVPKLERQLKCKFEWSNERRDLVAKLVALLKSTGSNRIDHREATRSLDLKLIRESIDSISMMFGPDDGAGHAE